MLHKGLVDYPELLATLPEVDSEDNDEIKEALSFYRSVTKMNEDREKRLAQCDEVDKLFFMDFKTEIKNKLAEKKHPESQQFECYSIAIGYWSMSSIGVKLKVGASDLIKSSIELGYLDGTISGYKLKNGKITEKGKGLFDLVENDGNSLYTVKYDLLEFPNTYEKIARHAALKKLSK